MRLLLLDRDGIVNRDTGYAHRHEDLELLPGTLRAARLAAQAGVPVAVVTNQSGIARGMFTVAQLHTLHRHIADAYRAAGAPISGFYFCPHLPEITGRCLCRKPGHLLVQRALARHHATPAHSLLVGDSHRDAAAAAAAGVPAIWVTGPPTSPWPTLPHTDALPEAIEEWLFRSQGPRVRD